MNMIGLQANGVRQDLRGIAGQGARTDQDSRSVRELALAILLISRIRPWE
jgi:hypothetical protein